MEFLESKRWCLMVLYNTFKDNFGSKSRKDGSIQEPFYMCIKYENL